MFAIAVNYEGSVARHVEVAHPIDNKLLFVLDQVVHLQRPIALFIILIAPAFAQAAFDGKRGKEDFVFVNASNLMVAAFGYRKSGHARLDALQVNSEEFVFFFRFGLIGFGFWVVLRSFRGNGLTVFFLFAVIGGFAVIPSRRLAGQRDEGVGQVFLQRHQVGP